MCGQQRQPWIHTECVCHLSWSNALVEDLDTRETSTKAEVVVPRMDGNSYESSDSNSFRVRRASRKSSSLWRKEAVLSVICCTPIMHCLRRLGSLPCHKTQQRCILQCFITTYVCQMDMRKILFRWSNISSSLFCGRVLLPHKITSVRTKKAPKYMMLLLLLLLMYVKSSRD